MKKKRSQYPLNNWDERFTNDLTQATATVTELAKRLNEEASEISLLDFWRAVEAAWSLAVIHKEYDAAITILNHYNNNSKTTQADPLSRLYMLCYDAFTHLYFGRFEIAVEVYTRLFNLPMVEAEKRLLLLIMREPLLGLVEERKGTGIAHPSIVFVALTIANAFTTKRGKVNDLDRAWTYEELSNILTNIQRRPLKEPSHA